MNELPITRLCVPNFIRVLLDTAMYSSSGPEMSCERGREVVVMVSMPVWMSRRIMAGDDGNCRLSGWIYGGEMGRAHHLGAFSGRLIRCTWRRPALAVEKR